MEEISTRAYKLSQLIKIWKFPIILTGAGLSTNSGIPDYRSGIKTNNLAGPGIMNFKDDPSFRKRVLDSRK